MRVLFLLDMVVHLSFVIYVKTFPIDYLFKSYGAEVLVPSQNPLPLGLPLRLGATIG